MQTHTREQMAHAGARAVPPDRRSRFRDRAAWWRYTLHLAEMVVAMLAGMAVLGAADAALGALPGSDRPLIQYAWMGVFMAAPMVAWMRRRGHTWADGAEMTAAMLVPMFALVLPVELGVALPGLSAHSLMVLAHVAMLAGMAALMVYRWDRYAGGAHRR